MTKKVVTPQNMHMWVNIEHNFKRIYVLEHRHPNGLGYI
jgi:hypothetical protein